jgi:hypothetical protein
MQCSSAGFAGGQEGVDINWAFQYCAGRCFKGDREVEGIGAYAINDSMQPAAHDGVSRLVARNYLARHNVTGCVNEGPSHRKANAIFDEPEPPLIIWCRQASDEGFKTIDCK